MKFRPLHLLLSLTPTLLAFAFGAPSKARVLPENDAVVCLPEHQTPNVLLWRGFEHQWGYNHRLNTLASFADLQECGEQKCLAQLIHEADSGTGADQGEFMQLYSLLNEPALASWSTSVELQLIGNEGELLSGEVAIPAPRNHTTRARGSETLVVLNGFEVRSNAEAKQPRVLSLSIDQSSPEEPAINWAFEVDCDTPECLQGDQVDYQVRIHVQWLAGPPLERAYTFEHGDFAGQWSGASVEHSYLRKWGTNLRNHEPNILDEARLIEGAHAESSAFAITGFLLKLDSPSHLQSIALNVQVDEQEGPATSFVGFSNWTPGMRLSNLWSLASYGQEGQYRGALRGVVVPDLSGSVRHLSSQGRINTGGSSQGLRNVALRASSPLGGDTPDI